MKIKIGNVFTGKGLIGRVEVIKIEGNDLYVDLFTGSSEWSEVWNLKHTQAGFKRGDYFWIK